MHLVKRILSFLLVILIVGYSGGINIAKHLCDGEVVAKALNHEVTVCKKAASTTPLTDDPSYSEKSCCDTEVSFFQSDTFSKTSVSFEFISSTIITHNYVPRVITLNNHSELIYTPPSLYDPPIYEFIEQYLI